MAAAKPPASLKKVEYGPLNMLGNKKANCLYEAHWASEGLIY